MNLGLRPFPKKEKKKDDNGLNKPTITIEDNQKEVANKQYNLGQHDNSN